MTLKRARNLDECKVQEFKKRSCWLRRKKNRNKKERIKLTTLPRR